MQQSGVTGMFQSVPGYVSLSIYFFEHMRWQDGAYQITKLVVQLVKAAMQKQSPVKPEACLWLS